MQIFKVIDIATQAKEGYRDPRGFLGNLSFALVQGYAISWFILVVLGLALNFFLGFIMGWWLFQLFFFFGIIVLVVSIIMYLKIRKFMQSMSNTVVDTVSQRFQKRTIVDVEVE